MPGVEGRFLLSAARVWRWAARRLLLFQICLLAEELGNHEGRLGWGEGSFYEKGTRGRQAHTRHQ